MNYKRAGISFGRTVHPPEPSFKICERTVPAEKLDSQGKEQTGNVDPFNPGMPPAEESSEDQEQYPQEVQ